MLHVLSTCLPSLKNLAASPPVQVVSEYFGESEAGLRGIFAAASALAPSVSWPPEQQAKAGDVRNMSSEKRRNRRLWAEVQACRGRGRLSPPVMWRPSNPLVQ